MTDRHCRRVLPLVLLIAAAAPVPAPSADEPSSADAVLGTPFQSRIEGIEFRPPAGGTPIRQLNSGEVVRFAYPDRAWTLVLKDAPNSGHLPMTVGPMLGGPAGAGPTTAAVGSGGTPTKGLLDLAADQMTQRGSKPAVLLRKDVVPVGPRGVGLIEAHDDAGTDHVLVQIALIPDGLRRYFILQMVSPADDARAATTAGGEAEARRLFEQSLGSVTMLDRAAFRREQEHRYQDTRGLWVQLDRKRIEAALEPVHYLRLVQDGHDIGYVQVNERVAQLHDQDGVFVVCREHLVIPPAPTLTAAPVTSPGVDPPRPTAAAAAARAAPTQLDRDAEFFCTFDRTHESWTSQTRLDDRPGSDAFEMGNSDAEVHRRFNPAALRRPGGPGGFAPAQPGAAAALVDEQVETLRVDNYRGTTRSAAPFASRVGFQYLPQALAQLLPRLLPVDEPNQFLFAFYVSEQRDTLARYVDVGQPTDVRLDGQTVRAVPIADRVGADGVVTTHYVDRADGRWLGTVSDDGKLQVLPTDADALAKVWKGFAVLPDPRPPVDDEPAIRHAAAAAPADAADPTSVLPPSLDSGRGGGR